MLALTLVVLIIVIVLFVLLLIIAGSLYNSVITLKVRTEEAYADIDTILKQRADMIPNLVNMVKGYMTHEQETLTKVTELRSQMINADDPRDVADAENMLNQSLKTIFALSENYPELKANENFMELQNDLSELEEKLQRSRRFYNASVRDYNTKIQRFPGNLFVGLFGFHHKEFFEASSNDRENVVVDFSNDA